MGNQPSGALAVGNDFSKMPTSQFQPPTFTSPIPPSNVYTPQTFGNSQDFNLSRVSEPLGNAAHNTADNFASGVNVGATTPRGAACTGCPGAGACGGGRTCVDDLW